MDKEIRVNRTMEGNVFEFVNAFVLLCLWGICAYMYTKSPDLIPTKFDANNDVTDYGPKWIIFLMPIITTVTTPVLLWTAYHPQQHVNILIPINNIERTRLASQMCRMLCLLINLMMFPIVMAMGQNIILSVDTSWALFFIIIFLIFIVTVMYMFRIYKVRT